MYARLGDYKSLATLPDSPLSAAERARAEWLADRQVVSTGPDSVIVALVPTGLSPIGSVTLLVGADTLTAVIDPRANGLMLDTAMARRASVRMFRPAAAAPAGPAIAVALDTRIGGAEGGIGWSAVPAVLAPLGGPRMARMGLDVLEDLTPTFSPVAAQLVLRKGGKVPATPPGGDRIPILIGPTGISLVREGVHPLESARGLALAGARWTLDVRHGEILAHR
jgi:hypothetical protein